MSENQNIWIRGCCQKYCKVEMKRDEAMFTRQQLLKIRQKRPAIIGDYRLRKIQINTYQKVMRDIGDINAMIDML